MSELPQNTEGEGPWVHGYRDLQKELVTRGIVPTELETHFDEIFESMQTPEHREAVDRTFHATPQELGEAARKAAEKKFDN